MYKEKKITSTVQWWNIFFIHCPIAYTMHTVERSGMPDIQFDIVSSSAQRYNAFANLLGHQNVRQVPYFFNESVIRKPVNRQPAEWPFEVAEQKALQDVAALLVIAASNEIARENMLGDIKIDGKRTIRLYSDTVQVVFDQDISDDTVKVLEKPENLQEWLEDEENGAMAQSGKQFEITTALTGFDITNPDAHPSTILVRFAGQMRPYTKKDIQDLLENFGPQDIMPVAGGISIQNGGTSLYDKTKPLTCYIQTDPNASPIVVFKHKTWEDVDLKTLQRYVYGAIPEAVSALIYQIDNSRYVRSTAKKKGMIFPYPAEQDIPWKHPPSAS